MEDIMNKYEDPWYLDDHSYGDEPSARDIFRMNMEQALARVNNTIDALKATLAELEAQEHDDYSIEGDIGRWFEQQLLFLGSIEKNGGK